MDLARGRERHLGREGARSSLDQTSGFIVDVLEMKLRRAPDGIFRVFPSRRERQVFPSINQVFQEERKELFSSMPEMIL